MAQGNVINRFVDAGKEPTRTLLPIEGYEENPLLSLKDAVASIETPIHNLKTMVWTAERNCDEPLDGLTLDESAAIHLYTMQWPEEHDSFYTLLNQKLRSEKRNELKSWFSYLKLFFTALYKLPSLKQIVWRGIRGDVSHLYRKDYIWWGVSSCTDTMEVMQKFVGRSGVRTLFMIECINGKAIQSHSFYKDENEIILMPGTYLRVVDKWSAADGLHIIRLQEETPPFKLIASPFDASSPVDTLPLNELIVIESNKSNSQATAPSVETLPLEKLTIVEPSQSISQAASVLPNKSTTATSLLSSPPKYKNTKLEQKINEIKDKSVLDLGNENLTNADMEIVGYYLLRNNKTLTLFCLHANQIGDRGAQYLGDGLQKNATLTRLDLDHNRIGDQGAQYLGEALQKNTTLAELWLSSNQIGDQGAQYLGEALQKNRTLTTLYLSGNQIGDRGAQYLGEALQKNTTLTELWLSSNKIGDKGAQYFGKALQKNTTLTELSLYTNQIGDQGAQYLGDGLQKNTTLTSLSLSYNQIGDRGAQYLGEALQNNTTLTRLDLDNNQIGAKGTQYLDKALRKNKTLKELYLVDGENHCSYCTIS